MRKGAEKESQTQPCVSCGEAETWNKLPSCVYVRSIWSWFFRLWDFSPALKTRPLYIHVKKIASRILDFSTSFLPTRAVYSISYCGQRSQSIKPQNVELPTPEGHPTHLSEEGEQISWYCCLSWEQPLGNCSISRTCCATSA